MKLVITYVLLAAIAMATNLGSQDVFLRIYQEPFAIYASILFGTAVGLITKYALDKKFIFRFQPRDSYHDGQTFILYALMGVITTLIFWGFELSFGFLFQTKEARYVGGAIGLVIGYTMKYNLDKKYVFRGEAATRAAGSPLKR